MSDVRLYADASGYTLDCITCGAGLWSYAYALEARHIAQVATITALHICGEDAPHLRGHR